MVAVMFHNLSPRLSLASFPGLPCLYLLFEFTVIHGNGRVANESKFLTSQDNFVWLNV